MKLITFSNLAEIPLLFLIGACSLIRASAPTPIALSFPTHSPHTPVPLASPTASLATPVVLIFPTLSSSDISPDMAAIANDYPRLDGSTSAHPLQVLFACKILNVACLWAPPLFSERRISPLMDSAPAPVVEQVLKIEHSGTHQAYVNLIENKTDLILVARVPSDDEMELALKRQVELDARPVALDAFVFLAHKDNMVESLTLDQIRGIYSGAITAWSELAGQPGQINAYQRNPNSGSQELMDELVMQGTAMIEAPDMIFESMLGPINAIHDDPLGLGYSVYFYATVMLPDENVKLMGVNGVVPSSNTIASGEYPLVTGVYAVLRADISPDSSAVRLRDWLLTEAGQSIVEESGYVAVR